MNWETLKKSVPLYVTNKTSDGFIFQLETTVLVALAMWFLFLANFLLWGGIGIWKAFEVMI